MIVCQYAFILYKRPYNETSLILDLFSEHEGRVLVLAKDACARRSKLKGCLQPFTPLLLYWSNRSNVKILRNAESVSLALPKKTGIMLYSALYINELLARVLEYETNYFSLFFHYLNCLKRLAMISVSPEITLRRFELALLTYLGYGVDFLHCASSGKPIVDSMNYRYQKTKGFSESMIEDQNRLKGYELRALAANEFSDIGTLRAAKRFTRMTFKPYLGNKLLKSREFFTKHLFY